MFTMLPPPFARRWGTAALHPYHAAFVLRRNDSSHSASGMSSNMQRVIGTTFSMPALFTMPLSLPKAFAASSTECLNCAKSRTAVANATALPPLRQMPSATSWLLFASMSSSATLAPSDARRSLYARPMPCAAPETTTPLSASRMRRLPPLSCRSRGPRATIEVALASSLQPLRGRGVADVAPDEDRDAAVVVRELGRGPLGVAGADRREELLVMLGRVLKGRPAERPCHFLTQPRDERHEPWPSRHRVQTDVEVLA